MAQNFPLPYGGSGLAPRHGYCAESTEPPGAGLQSDLDLIVKIGSTERHGNMAPGSADFDRINNVEQVVWADVPQGTAAVTVSAHSIAIQEQNFALVVRFS